MKRVFMGFWLGFLNSLLIVARDGRARAAAWSILMKFGNGMG